MGFAGRVGLGAALAWGLALGGSQIKPTLRIVTYGTSLTAGGLWQRDLQRTLVRCLRQPVTIVNLGKGGRTSDWGVKNVGVVIRANPDVVLIEFAINDAYEANSISLDDSYDNTARIVVAIREALPGAKVEMMTTNPTFVPGRVREAGYQEQYRRLAADLRTGLIDLFPAWSAELVGEARRRLIPDGIHPTADGYRKVAARALADGIGGPDCR